MENLQLVLPEIFLSLSIMFLLIFGVFKKNSSRLVQSLSLAVLIVPLLLLLTKQLVLMKQNYLIIVLLSIIYPL